MDQKFILVKETTKEAQTLIDQGWNPTNAFPHPKGSLILLQRAKLQKRRK